MIKMRKKALHFFGFKRNLRNLYFKAVNDVKIHDLLK